MLMPVEPTEREDSFLISLMMHLKEIGLRAQGDRIKIWP
jgi:hypothetical protein